METELECFWMKDIGIFHKFRLYELGLNEWSMIIWARAEQKHQKARYS